MSNDRKHNIKELTDFYSEMQDFESYAKNFNLQPPLCDEPCEEFQLHGFSACIDCLPY